jgi:hypothetical protein
MDDRVVPLRRAALLCVLALAACSEAPEPAGTSGAPGSWREFSGSLTAAGNRQVLLLGEERRASVVELSGSMLLGGPSRPNAGFRADMIAFNDSASGMIGRAVWTDENGDKVFSELRGQGTATGNRIDGTFVGGTGRYAGASGDYHLSWQYVLESEDGTVQGRALGLAGRVRVGASAEASPSEGTKK